MNPELRRNLWLEFSWQRVLAVPLVIALATTLITLIRLGTDRPAALLITTMSALGYAAVVLLWGTRMAGMSVSTEVHERTWDAQRMSAISPWTMTWGKLLGAPSFTWYAGALLLGLFMVTGWGQPALPVARLALAMVLAGLLLHAVALITSLFAARRGLAHRTSSLLAVSGLLLLLILPGVGMLREVPGSIVWWGMPFAGVDFLLGSLLLFAAWALLGASRSMCSALEIRTLPWALPAFILFTAPYLAGLPDGPQGGPRLPLMLGSGLMLSLGLTYLLMLVEPTPAQVVQRLVLCQRLGQWRRVAQGLPLWLLALGCALLFALAWLPFSPNGGRLHDLRLAMLAPLSLVLYALRDAAILHYFALSPRPRRVEAAAMLQGVLLYLLLPGLFEGLGLSTVATLVRPPILRDSGLDTLVIGLQAALALGLVVWRWRRVHAPDLAATLARQQA